MAPPQAALLHRPPVNIPDRLNERTVVEVGIFSTIRLFVVTHVQTGKECEALTPSSVAI